MTNKDYRDIVLERDRWLRWNELPTAHLGMKGNQKTAFKKIRAAFPDVSGMTMPVLADPDHGVYLAIISDGKGIHSTRSIVGVNGHDPKILYTCNYDENSDVLDNLPHHPKLIMLGNERFLTYEIPRTAAQREDSPELWDKIAIPLDNVVPMYPVLERPLENRVSEYATPR